MVLSKYYRDMRAKVGLPKISDIEKAGELLKYEGVTLHSKEHEKYSPQLKSEVEQMLKPLLPIRSRAAKMRLVAEVAICMANETPHLMQGMVCDLPTPYQKYVPQLIELHQTDSRNPYHKTLLIKTAKAIVEDAISSRIFR